MKEADSPSAWPREASDRLAQYGMFTIRRDRLRSPRNDTTHEFEIIEAPDAVTVLALTDQGQMVLVEQFRHGVRRSCLELPSGLMEEEESDPVSAGLRELREETGYLADRARRIGTLTLNPAWQTTRVHVVLARGVEPGAERDLDEGEDTRTRVLPLERVWELVRDGSIDSAVIVAALGLLRLQEPEL